MIDEKKLLDKLQQWHDDAEKMKEVLIDALHDAIFLADTQADMSLSAV